MGNDGAGEVGFAVEVVRLGLGDALAARLPTLEEQARLGIGEGEPVFVIDHPDRDPDVIAAAGVTVSTRPFGVLR